MPRSVPELIKKIRELRGLTQEALARELGVTFSTVNGWENGKHKPMPLLLNALLKLGRDIGLAPDIDTGPRSRGQRASGERTGGGDGSPE